MKDLSAPRVSINRIREEIRRKMKDSNDGVGHPGEKDKITALLQLRAKLEQELRADNRKLDDLKKECESKLTWIHYLDEVLSEASFQPASELLHDASKLDQTDAYEHVNDKGLLIDLKSFNEPVNIKNTTDGMIYATLNFMQGNILIMLNEKLRIIPESKLFQDIFQKEIAQVFEKEGGKVFIERDDSGVLRMITIQGSFKTELKEIIIKRLVQVVAMFRETAKELV